MYIEETSVPVLRANRFSPAGRRMMRYPAYTGPRRLLSGLGALTQQQKEVCERAKKLLPNMPWATSPECGLCPPPSDVPCPAPEEQGYITPDQCPAPEEQGYITPDQCPAFDYEEKTAEATGLAWWWILVAAAAGVAAGAAGGYYMGKKPGAI